MATHRISIWGNLLPDLTGRAFVEPYTIKAANDKFGHPVGVLVDPASAQAHGFYGVFDLPQNYVGTASAILFWTSTATTGNGRFRFSYRAIGGTDAESLDQTTYQEQVSVTTAAPGATDRRIQTTFTLTSGNLAPGDTVEYLIERFDDTGVDTIAAAVTVHDLCFSYADV